MWLWEVSENFATVQCLAHSRGSKAGTWYVLKRLCTAECLSGSHSRHYQLIEELYLTALTEIQNPPPYMGDLCSFSGGTEVQRGNVSITQ